jgi:nitroreductase
MELAFNTHESMIKAIIKSQHTQRNWDLTREIPADDMKVLEASVTQCPSKQNFAFYKTTFITNRSIIEQIHEQTKGLGYIDTETRQRVECTNPQALANLLVVFEEITPSEDFNKHHSLRNENKKSIYERDRDTALGIAVGYMNVVATMLGYETGCCACYNAEAIQTIIGLEGKPVLLMGIGYKDPNKQRREHHTLGVKIPRRPKEEIKVNYIV